MPKSISLNPRLIEQINEAAVVIARGGVVAFPTETTFGLAVDPYNEAAVSRLFSLKERDPQKAVLLLVNGKEQLSSCVSEIPVQYNSLIADFWPGPLTLIFPSKQNISRQIVAADATVAIRHSPHPVAQALVDVTTMPITATSANISGKAPALSAAECRDIFADSLDYVIDAPCSGRASFSTIVGLGYDGELQIIRQGECSITL